MTELIGIQGKVTAMEGFDTNTSEEQDCNQLLTLSTKDNQLVQFVLRPSTFIIDRAQIRPGNTITCYYDSSMPVPLIYPPRYQAIIVSKPNPYENVYVGYFDEELVNQDNTLKLNVGSRTIIELPNGLAFTGQLENRNLAVIYGSTTRSIPAQTTPSRIIVLCI